MKKNIPNQKQNKNTAKIKENIHNIKTINRNQSQNRKLESEVKYEVGVCGRKWELKSGVKKGNQNW